MQTVYLDISNKGTIPLVYAKQNEVGRKILVVLTDSGVPYSPPGGSVFSVWYDGDSGDGNYTDIGEKSAFSINGNKVEVELITQMLGVPGEGVLCLVLNGAGGSQIASWNIKYTVEMVPGANSEQATSYYTAFSNAVANLPYPDASLTAAGKAADAAAVGQALAQKLSTSGGTINGSLNMSGRAVMLTMMDTETNSKAMLYKNAGVSGDVLKDYGTQLQDFSAADGLRDAFVLCRNEELSKKLRMIVRKDDDSGDTNYYLYGTHNKPTASDVGAVPTSRTVNGKALSSNITLSVSDVGAAPDGYGLGSAKLISADAIDTTTAPGFYCISATMTVNNITANYWYMIVGGYGRGTQHCVQKLYPVTSYRTELVRFLQSGVFREWECTNPPMVVGVEYRTTERYNGKSVYTMLFDFGSLSNASTKVVAHNIQNLDRGISATGLFSEDMIATIPYVGTEKTTVQCSMIGGGVRIRCEDDETAWVAHVILKYTKTTD